MYQRQIALGMSQVFGGQRSPNMSQTHKCCDGAGCRISDKYRLERDLGCTKSSLLTNAGMNVSEANSTGYVASVWASEIAEYVARVEMEAGYQTNFPSLKGPRMHSLR